MEEEGTTKQCKAIQRLLVKLIYGWLGALDGRRGHVNGRCIQRSAYVCCRVVKPDVDLFFWAHKASSERSSHIHHRLYCLIEIKKINLAKETFVNRRKVGAKQM